MPKKFVKLDSQILTAFSTCERKMEYGFIRHLQLIEAKYALERGSLIHDILECYYKELKESRNRIASVKKALELGRAKINTYNSIDVPRGIEILDNMGQYFSYYMNDKWLPVETEKIHKKLIFEDEELAILYIAKIDVVVMGDDQFPLMPVDHKGYDRWFDPLSLDNQFTGYANQLDVNCITVNKIGFQKSYTADKKFRRVKLTYTEARRAEWVHNTARLVKDMVFCMETGTFPMRRSQCGMYGGCDMLKICEIDPRAREMVIQKLYRVTEPWDPEKASYD